MQFSRLLDPIKANQLPYLKAIFSRCVIICVEISGILVIQKIAQGAQEGDILLIQQWSIFLIGVVVVSLLFKRSIRHWFWPNSTAVSEQYLWHRYFHAVIQLDSTHVEKLGTGRMIDIVHAGIKAWTTMLELFCLGLVDIGLKLGFACYMVAQISWSALLLFLVLLITMFVIVVYINTFALASRAGRKDIEVGIMRRFIRLLMSRLEVLHSDKVTHEAHQQKEDLQRLLVINRSVNNNLFWMYQMPVNATYLLTVGIGWYAYTSLQQGIFSWALFAGLVAITGYFLALSLNYTTKLKDASRDIVHIERLVEEVDDAPQLRNYTSGNEFVYEHGDIELRDVSFTYHEGAQVFDRFSLHIAGGKKTALVGASGSGKTTLVKLISGLLSPDSGTIHIDRQDISGTSLKSLYQHIGMLQQEPVIFDGTIRENIQYSLAAPLSEAELKTIIDKAQCQFVYACKEGVDTEVGERGIRLSGGQKQRLAIARIFAKNPNIILLDEPTSALDSQSEEAITTALDELSRNKTVIIIAHRLQTVKHADAIIFFEDGKIVEQGTHDSLLAQGGHYAKMVELQTGF